MTSLPSAGISPSTAAQDISRGLESRPIPVQGVSGERLDSLSRFEQYIVDSILPDGISIVSAPPFSTIEAADDNEDELGTEEGGCECELDNDGGLTCTRRDGDICDCVASFGNFYDSQSQPESHRQQLNLDALPDRWPLVECSPDCACAATCGNRVTQRGVELPLTVRPVPHAGLGLFYTPQTNTAIQRGTFVSLYAGEYLTTTQARSRWSDQTRKPSPGDGNYVLSLRLPDRVIHIDPRRIGNIGRFLNHSCDPNCVIQVVRWGPDSWPRAAIFTKRDIAPDEELTFDYGDASGADKSLTGLIQSVAGDGGQLREEDDGSGRTLCFCGTATCRGVMPFDGSL